MVLFQFGIAGQTNDFWQWIVAGKLKNLMKCFNEKLMSVLLNFQRFSGDVDVNLHLFSSKHLFSARASYEDLKRSKKKSRDIKN
jgi:hypothetical protein